MKKRKYPVKRRSFYRKSPFIMRQKTWVYDDDTITQSVPSQVCLYCYEEYLYSVHKRFHIKERFCPDCRTKIFAKDWRVVSLFYNMMAKSLKHNLDLIDSLSDQLQFIVGVYRCVRFKKSRDYLVETIKDHVNLSHLASPMVLGEIMEEYDTILDLKQKRKCRHNRLTFRKIR